MWQNHLPEANVNGLKEFVYRTLCEIEQLEIGVFPMTVNLLKRGTTICGIYFCLHGPRSVKFTAIWESEQNTILFYSASGARCRRVPFSATSDISA